MIQKPYNISIQDKVFDGNLPYLLSWKTSGDTSNSFSIDVYYNDTDEVALSIPRTYSLALSYNIPPRTFSNGYDYKIKITVWDSNDNTATSDFVMFTTLSAPSITMSFIGTIGNQSNTFKAMYSQNESDPVNYYTVNLYDTNKILIQTSGILTDDDLTYTFDLLQNNTSYFVEFVVNCQKGLQSTTGLVPFNVVYDNFEPPLNITVENTPETASATLNWKLNQIIGKADIQPEYINGEEVDMRLGKVYFDEDFEVDDDFTLKIWIRELTKNVDLIYLTNNADSITVQYSDDNRFYLDKTSDGVMTQYISNQANGIQIFLYIQQIDGEMNIFAESEIMEKDVIRSITGMTFSDLTTKNIILDNLKYSKLY